MSREWHTIATRPGHTRALEAWDVARNDPALSAKCRRYAANFSWDVGVHRLLEHLPVIAWESETIPLTRLERSA